VVAHRPAAAWPDRLLCPQPMVRRPPRPPPDTVPGLAKHRQPRGPRPRSPVDGLLALVIDAASVPQATHREGPEAQGGGGGVEESVRKKKRTEKGTRARPPALPTPATPSRHPLTPPTHITHSHHSLARAQRGEVESKNQCVQKENPKETPN
jgi:hypothetical protein